MSPKTLFFISSAIALVGAWLLFGHWPISWNDRLEPSQAHALLELVRLVVSLLFTIAVIGYFFTQFTRFSIGIKDGPSGIRDNPWLTRSLAVTTPFMLMSVICVGFAFIASINSFKIATAIVLSMLCGVVFQDMSKRVFQE